MINKQKKLIEQIREDREKGFWERGEMICKGIDKVDELEKSLNKTSK